MGLAYISIRVSVFIILFLFLLLLMDLLLKSLSIPPDFKIRVVMKNENPSNTSRHIISRIWPYNYYLI